MLPSRHIPIILYFLYISGIQAADTFTVATFNVENYFLTKFGTRSVKPELSRSKVADAIVSIHPDVLALLLPRCIRE